MRVAALTGRLIPSPLVVAPTIVMSNIAVTVLPDFMYRAPLIVTQPPYVVRVVDRLLNTVGVQFCQFSICSYDEPFHRIRVPSAAISSGPMNAAGGAQGRVA